MIKKTSYFIVILLLCFSCNKTTKHNKIISDAENIVSVNPDSAIVILQAIEVPENLQDSTKANYWLAMGQAHYNSSKSLADDSLLLYSKVYYNDYNTNKLRFIQANKLAAFHLLWNNKQDDAMKLLHETLKVAEANNDTIGMVSIYRSLANWADKENDIDKGLFYTKKLLEINKNAPDYYRYYRDLGIIYFFKNDADSSFAAFEQGINYILNSDNNESHYYDMRRNYADVLNEMGEPHKAIGILHELMNSTQDKDNLSLSYMALSRCYLNLHQLDSANYYMQKANDTRPDYFYKDLALSNMYMNQEVVLNYANSGKFKLNNIALFSNKMYNNYLDKESTLAVRTNNLKLSEQRNLELNIAKQHNQIVLLIMLLVLFISGGLVYFYIQRRRKAFEEKKEELETLKKLLHEAEKSSDSLKKDDRFFKRILLQQLGLIRLAATSPTAHNQEFLQQMARIADKDIPVETLLNWDDLYQVIDSIYNNFYTKLSLKYGDILIDKEIQLCCLLASEFSTKEISVVTQQSVRTTYQRKTTIRRKLQMDEKEDIIDFLSL